MIRSTGMSARDFSSSFLSCEKDIETILRKLFVESKPYSDILKKLLVINTSDCLDDAHKQVYQEIINKKSLRDLKDEGYIRLAPKITMGEHEEVKSYLIIGFNNFTSTSNDEFRDCIISIDIMCHTDQWDLGNFRLRPIKIAGYIDGILNKARLSGIGRLEFISCTELLLDENLSGYTLIYRAVHGSDDKLKKNE